MVLFLNSLVPPEMSSDFSGMFPAPALKIYVPKESYDAYRNADGWNQHAGIIYKRSIIENGFAIKDNVLIQYVENHSEITL